MNHQWIPHPPPLEEVDPELGELLRQFCNGELKSIPKKIGRNDPCYCNSGKKFKKCCGKNV